MNKKLVYALVLIGLSVIVMLLTKGSTSVNLIFDTVSAPTSMVLLASAAMGVLIGVMLK